MDGKFKDMKINIAFILFWSGIISIIGSYWSYEYAYPLKKTGWALIWISLFIATSKAIMQQYKKNNKVKGDS